MSDLDDLRGTVEALRREHYPRLPAALVEAVLKVESDHVEDRGPAPRLVEAAIDKHLKGK